MRSHTTGDKSGSARLRVPLTALKQQQDNANLQKQELNDTESEVNELKRLLKDLPPSPAVLPAPAAEVEDKFYAKTLILGQSAESALGLAAALGLSGGTFAALAASKSADAAAISPPIDPDDARAKRGSRTSEHLI